VGHQPGDHHNVSFAAGQFAATTLRTAFAVGIAGVAAWRSSGPRVAVALAPLVVAVGKAYDFDRHWLPHQWAGASIVFVSIGILLTGFVMRYAARTTPLRLEVVAIGSAAGAVLSSAFGVDTTAP
jgi:hypothetical protein